MTEKSNSGTSDFRTIIPGYSDEEIINILKKRKLYQKEAAEIAIKEALKRGLIYSEQDLFDEGFQVEPVKFSLFPTIEDKNTQIKIIKSISRSLIISGAIPTIWGFLKLNDGKTIEGGILLVSGILWIYFSAMLIRKASLDIVNSLFVLLFLSVVYFLKLFLKSGTFIFIDIFVTIVVFCLITYGLLFLRRLIQ